MPQKRVADVVADFIAQDLGIRHVFMLTGAGIMHLTDGVALRPDLEAICVHHEQSAAMAMDAYARAHDGMSVGYFTTGPGVTNAITGLAGAWQDSVPCLFISGQVKRSECAHTSGVKGLRQFGVQELDIIPMVASVSKYAVHLTNPQHILFELQKAVHIAKTGRPGPVWLELPMDVQAAIVETETLPHFTPPASHKPDVNQEDVKALIHALRHARRPVIIAGQGVRLAGARSELEQLATTFNIPIVTPYLGIDNLPQTLDVVIGKTGVKGDRPANYAMQNSDFILAIGTSLHVSVTGYDYKQFAREATIAIVDIDPTAHQKTTIKQDLVVIADAKDVLKALIDGLKDAAHTSQSSWLDMCKQWKARYPVNLPEYTKTKDAINIYSFVDHLSRCAGDHDCILSDAGSAFYAVSQGLQLRTRTQRYIPSSAMATMGFSLPASIGAALARPHARTLAVTGDGSFQQNIQELQTLLHYKLPVALFVLNNDGYLSIRASQKNYFQNRWIGEGPRSGVTMPDTLKICEAYGIPARRVSEYKDLDEVIEWAKNIKGPCVVDVITPPEQLIIPTVASRVNEDGTMSSRPLEDMFPFLDREEYRSNLLVSEV